MRKIGFIFMLLVSWTSFSQVQLTGVVKDSIGTPLEMANVIALDTVAKRIVSFGFTDAKGNFKLDLKTNTTYNVKISYIGYSEISQFVKTKESNQSFNFTMNEDKMLDGISIVSKMPVIVKGDTIIYNADSFKNGSERKLEDVLKKLPGVEINDAGEIEVEGKAVEKITVDGKDFFSGDTKLASKNIPFHLLKDQVIFAKGEVLKQDQTPYTVYTPFKNKWREQFATLNLVVDEELSNPNFTQLKNDFPALEEIGFVKSKIKVKPYKIENIANYSEIRNYPAVDGTSYLSPHLRFGTISIRSLTLKFRSNTVLLDELIWREFFMQILFHFPKVVDGNFREKYDFIQWRINNNHPVGFLCIERSEP